MIRDDKFGEHGPYEPTAIQRRPECGKEAGADLCRGCKERFRNRKVGYGRPARENADCQFDRCVPNW